MGYLANFERVLAELLVPSIGEFERRQAIQELRLPESTRWAAKKTDTDESIAAERYIRGVMVHTLEEGMQSLTKGDLARARAELEIAAECTPDDGFVLYQLARAYALGKDQRRALTVLRESVENGFSDLDQLEKKSDFAALRSEADYTRIVDMLKQRLVVSPTAAKRSR